MDKSNPVQTIENFFDYAFLVKSKRVVEEVGKLDGLPYGLPADPGKVVEKYGQGSSQLILSLGIKELREVADLLPNNGACPLHREDELYEAETAAMQVCTIVTATKKLINLIFCIYAAG